MQKQEKKKLRIATAVSTAVLAMAVVLCLTVAIQVLVRGYANLAGYSLFRVVTGSMEPSIPVNALVVSKHTAIEDIAVGDIVVFRSRTALTSEKIITHRVVAVTQREDGTAALETRGDANSVADNSVVTQRNLIGKVVWTTKQGSGAVTIIGFLSSKLGFLACIVFPILFLGGLILRGSIVSIRRQLNQVIRELDDVQQPPPAEEQVNMPPANYRELLSAAEYEAIYNSVKAEVLEELQADVDGNR